MTIQECIDKWTDFEPCKEELRHPDYWKAMRFQFLKDLQNITPSNQQTNQVKG